MVEIVFEAKGNGNKDEVEEEHGDPHALGHLPVEHEDGEEDEHEHSAEDCDGADHPLGRNRHWPLKHHGKQEPWKR